MTEITLSHIGETAYESSSREFGGQPKAGERHSVQERGDLLDPAAIQRQHGDRICLQSSLCVIPSVLAERRLAVGDHWQQAPRSIAAQHMPGEERADGVHLADPETIDPSTCGAILSLLLQGLAVPTPPQAA